MKLTIHRGTHEIGGSCVELEHEGERILLDLGMPLADPTGGPIDMRAVTRATNAELEERGILPRLERVFAHECEGKTGVLGVFLSHAHADHYGLCEYLRDDVPIHLSEGTRRLIDLGRIVSAKPAMGGSCRIFSHGVPVEVGPFRVTPYLVDHSVFDAYAFVVEAGGKRVIYTGDFRDHGRKPGMLASFLRNAPKGADALLIEGTLVGSAEPGRSKPESEVERELVGTFRNSPGYVFVAASSQNVDRIVSLYHAALQTSRILVLDVHTANIVADLAAGGARIPHPSRSFDRIRVYFPRRIATRYAETGHIDLLYRFRPYKITRDEMAEHPGKIAMMLKPSMIRDAELMAGVEGSTLVWSQWSGYLREKSSERLQKFVESKRLRLVRHHTGGHADPMVLRKVIGRLQPKRVVPMHTANPAGFDRLSEQILFPVDRERMDLCNEGG